MFLVTLKRGVISFLQKFAAENVSSIVQLCCGRETNPSGKIVKNLCSFLSSNADFTPQVANAASGAQLEGIITLLKDPKGLSSASSRPKRGRPLKANAEEAKTITVRAGDLLSLDVENEVRECAVSQLPGNTSKPES